MHLPSSPPREAPFLRPLLLALSVAALAAPKSMAAPPVLFADDFDSDSSSQWSVFDGADDGVSDYEVIWAYDYSAFQYVSNGVTNSIPPAPNGNGTTRGVKITVNNNDDVAATSAVSLYPTGKTFSGDFALKVDVWMNYNGPAFGGTGSTEFATFGIHHAGDKVVWDHAAFNGDGVWFAMAGEGGGVRDYRAFVGDNATPNVELQGFDAGFLDRNLDGTREFEVNPTEADALNPLKAILPAPPGETPGAPGKQWVEVEIRHRDLGDGMPMVTWLINGHVIAEHTQAAIFGQTEGNIMLGYMDTFASIAVPAEENFVIFDNLRVVDITGVEPPGTVEIVAEIAEASEPSTPGMVVVSRSGDTSAPLTVPLRVFGTATPGVDFEALPDHVEFAAGETSVTLTITPIDDDAGEADETIIVALGQGEGYEIRERNSAVVTLSDDGDVPAATVTAISAIAYELPGTRPGRVAINLSTPSFADVTVSYTVGGDAVVGEDFQALPGTALIPAGETRVIVPVIPVDNNEIDGDRTVTLTLSEGTGYRLGEAVTATVTIRNDDLPPGETVFGENFESDAESRWTVNPGPTDYVADFAFDYSTVGIPPAPRSSGTTRGLMLQANLISGVFGGVSVSPSGGDFGENFRLRFDMWQNFNGPLPDGGNGSTQISGAGVGTAGTTAQWPGGTQDSVWFATSADGGSSVDYRAYSPASPTGYTDDSGVFAAGTTGNPRDNAHPYYAEFGLLPAPQAQVDSFPNQAGETFVGAQGFQWHDVVIEKIGGVVTYTIDGLRIATVTVDPSTLGGNNILLMHSDINAGSSTDPNAASLAFALFDNILVQAIDAAAPAVEIVSVALEDGSLVLEFTGAAGDAPDSFQILGSAEVNGTYAAEEGVTVEQVSPGRFRVELPADEAARFFRVAR